MAEASLGLFDNAHYASASPVALRYDLFSQLLLPSLMGILLTTVSWGHGAYHDQVEMLSEKIKRQPTDTASRFKLACAHQEHGEWVEALVELELVERMAPGAYETGLIQGMALAAGKHWEQALVVLEEFIKVKPENARALRQRGRVLNELGRIDNAIADLENALAEEEWPTPEHFVELADLLTNLGRKEQAFEVLEMGRRQLGNEPVILESELESALSLKRWDDALNTVAALQKKAPRPEPWMARHAEILEAPGRLRQARFAWVVLRDHLLSLPSLERGSGQLADCLTRARLALGETPSAPVAAPPASQTSFSALPNSLSPKS